MSDKNILAELEKKVGGLRELAAAMSGDGLPVQLSTLVYWMHAGIPMSRRPAVADLAREHIQGFDWEEFVRNRPWHKSAP